MTILSPSLLASDFSNLDREIKKVYDAGCKYLHLDVMDGLFVKNITFGIPVISSIRKVCNIVFDTHLMIVNPVRYIDAFVQAGSDIITFHYEACNNDNDIYRTIEKIKQTDVKCSMSIKPDTEIETLKPFLPLLDMVLVMSVEPGFGGQKFISKSLDKIKYLSKMKADHNFSYDIQVDGGVTLENAAEVKRAGANVIVAGTAIFQAENIKEVAEEIIYG